VTRFPLCCVVVRAGGQDFRQPGGELPTAEPEIDEARPGDFDPADDIDRQVERETTVSATARGFCLQWAPPVSSRGWWKVTVNPASRGRSRVISASAAQGHVRPVRALSRSRSAPANHFFGFSEEDFSEGLGLGLGFRFRLRLCGIGLRALVSRLGARAGTLVIGFVETAALEHQRRPPPENKPFRASAALRALGAVGVRTSSGTHRIRARHLGHCNRGRHRLGSP